MVGTNTRTTRTRTRRPDEIARLTTWGGFSRHEMIRSFLRDRG